MGAATVAGALIGLLFVAISVTPAAVTSKVEHLDQRVRAAAAMSAFLNSLLLSMLALIPGITLRPAVLTLSSVGIASTVALIAVMLIRAFAAQQTISVRRRARSVLWLVLLLAAYVWQLTGGTRLVQDRPDAGSMTTQAVIIVVLFAIGVSRAWELVGARKPQVVATLRAVGDHTHQSDDAEEKVAD
ncbi:MAG TPA: hypothetical protein VGN81_24195 [Pseudonocardiaceae bacterium]|jgi:hypothetical protein